MESCLSTSEALHVSNAFLIAMYGSEIFDRWRDLKHRMNFSSEREFVTWILNCLDGDEVDDNEIDDCENELFVQTTTSQSVNVVNANLQSEMVENDPIPNIDESPPECPVNGQFTSDDLPLTSSSSSFQEPHKNTSNIYDGDDIIFVNDDDYDESNDAAQNVTKEEATTDHVRDSTNNDNKPPVNVHISADNKSPFLKRYRCTECPYTTDMKSSYETHFRTHTGERPFACTEPHCTRTFRSRSNMTSHVRSVHRGIKNLRCQHCSYRAAKKSNLRDHLVNRHGYKGQYRCTKCGKYQTSTAAHRLHMQTHTQK